MGLRNVADPPIPLRSKGQSTKAATGLTQGPEHVAADTTVVNHQPDRAEF